jgi:CheY-like chemotaxis protein
MSNQHEHHPVKVAANELNNLLQVIGDSAQAMYNIARWVPDTARYYDAIRDCLQRGAATIRVMLDELARTGELPAAESGVPNKANLSGLIALEANTDARAVSNVIRIANPEGALELVMIVDDEQMICTQAERVLTSQGYRVLTVTDPLRAVATYRKLQTEINLVILDFTMPFMDGSEVFEELRSINPRVPVVVSSGFAEQDKLKAMLAKGLRGFLPKPYTQQKLLAQVRWTLDSLKGERRTQPA